MKKNTPRSNRASIKRLLVKSRLLIIIVGITVLGTVAYTSFAATPSILIKVASFNLLGQQWDGATPHDTWDQRKPRIKNIISSWGPGIIGMQEVSAKDPNKGNKLDQRNDTSEFMQKLGYAGVYGSIDNSDPIFWRTDNFSLVGKREVLIVQAHPGKPQPAARYLTHVRLENNGKYLSVFNYHYNQTWDKEEQLDRLKTAVNDITTKGDAIVFTGDFNGYQSKIVSKIQRLRVLDSADGPDHVIGSDSIVTRKWELLPQSNPTASDHRMITTNLTVN
ncbi:hypothetical protein BH09PAT3_BH09PAT3_6080 [soil metagenome]